MRRWLRRHAVSIPALSHRLHEVEAKALELKQHAGEAIDAFKARVKAAGDALARTVAGIRERVTAGASSTAHFVGDQAHNLQATAGDVKHRAQDLYGEYPLAAGAIGVAIGALIGAAAPLSSVERKGLHGVADTTAKATAGLADKGAHAVERATEKVAAALH